MIIKLEPFDFLDEGWIWEEKDRNFAKSNEVDLSKVILAKMMMRDEVLLPIRGDEILLRLKDAGYLRLDARVCLTLYRNQHLIPDSWKDNIVYFYGTILSNRDRKRYVPYLCWDGFGWCLRYYLFYLGPHIYNEPVAVLKG